MEYIIIAAAFAGIIFGSDWLVDGAVSLARRFRLSEFVIGAVIVGIGTSMPELIVSTVGAVNGNADIAIGNVVGSNIFNVLGILGLTAVFFPIAVHRENMRFEIPFCIFVTILMLLLLFNFFTGGEPALGRFDAIIMLLMFAVFMVYSIHRGRQNTQEQAPATAEEVSPLWKSAAKTTAGLALLAFSCDLFVDEAIVIARSWGASEAFISITLIACGTSLPELAASVTAALKKNTSLALGNIVGSNIFNITLILGLAPLLTPMYPAGITAIDYIVMASAVIALPIAGLGGKIGRPAGILMLCCFVAYNLWLVFSETGLHLNF